MKLGCFLLVGLWSICVAAVSSPFIAHVDKTAIKVGESFVLTLEYAGRAKEEPDWFDLQQDFSILSKQTSTQTSFINGDFQAKTLWVLELVPKKTTKELSIPPIKLGQHSTATIRLTQSEQKTANGNNDITFDVSTNKDKVYINGKIILNIAIKTTLLLRQGILDKPDIKDAIIEPMAEDELNEVIENGIRYFVFKRSYAIFPAKAGVLSIPPMTFKAVTASHHKKNHLWSDFFERGKQVSARSEAITIEVKDIPRQYPKGHLFLPVEDLVVIESFDQAEPQFEVNKAVARRFEIKAKGTLASFLPAISVPTINGLQIYNEAPQKSVDKTDGEISASVKSAHIYMPTAPGKVNVPEQIIYWWDTTTDKLKTTVIRSLDIDVTGVALSAINQPPLPKPLDQPPENTKEIIVPKASNKSLWPLLALLLGLLWLVTIMAWLFWLKRSKSHKNKELSYREQLNFAIQDIKSLCEKGDAKGVYSSLQQLRLWLQKHGQAHLYQKLHEDVCQLEAALFEKDKRNDIASLLTQISATVNNLKMDKFPPKNKLVPLYPV